jgi:hypothetical protein
MYSYLGRKNKSRRKKYKSKTLKLLLITNLWLCYIILLSVNYFVQDTYSFFNDNEQIQETIGTAQNFCSFEDFRKKNNKKCKCKDNSGLGNGAEPCDEYEYVIGDEDNPGHPEYCPEGEVCDDHPKEPKNPKDPKDPKDPKEPKEPKDPKDPKGPKSSVNPKNSIEPEDPNNLNELIVPGDSNDNGIKGENSNNTVVGTEIIQSGDIYKEEANSNPDIDSIDIE